MSVVGATIRLKSKPIQIHARLGTVVRAEVMPRIQELNKIRRQNRTIQIRALFASLLSPLRRPSFIRCR